MAQNLTFGPFCPNEFFFSTDGQTDRQTDPILEDPSVGPKINKQARSGEN